MESNRRQFLKTSSLGAAAITLGGIGMSAKSYGNIKGANDRVRVGVVGFSDRFRHSLLPSFLNHSQKLNFDIVALSDLWNRRRDEGQNLLKEKLGHDIKIARNNEELYGFKDIDAVIISTADFQHALHTIEAINAGCDAYIEKPFAETMADARAALKASESSGRILQIGSQRRSASNYIAAADFIKSGKFGPITIVEMCWNVNQPGRWRRPDLVSSIKESDTDWKKYLMNRPFEPWDPRKYLEYRLFWPYSSGIPGQWMSHQIDTVHWFSGFDHPRSVSANGGIYWWNDGRKNADTMTAVFDYGPEDDLTKGFQVVYSSRMHNSAGWTKEWYFSNGGKLDLEKNIVSSEGGMKESEAKAMGLAPNLLADYQLPSMVAESGANTGSDPMTTAHMLNWMECVRSRKEPNANLKAGYNHSIANIMVTAALRTGSKVTFDKVNQEVIAGDKVFTL